VSISERKKEIKRRRHRKAKLAKLHAKLQKCNPAERAAIAVQVRRVTPGAETVIKNWGLKEIA
jgi:hypothetical protein